MRWSSLRWPIAGSMAARRVAFDLLGDAGSLAGGVDLELVRGRGAVAAVADIGYDAIERVRRASAGPFRKRSAHKTEAAWTHPLNGALIARRLSSTTRMGKFDLTPVVEAYGVSPAPSTTW
jgi:hypothetical protein